eukprot:Rmarinus@m.20950
MRLPCFLLVSLFALLRVTVGNESDDEDRAVYCEEVTDRIRRHLLYVKNSVGEWNTQGISISPDIMTTTTVPYGGDASARDILWQHYQALQDLVDRTLEVDGYTFSFDDLCLRGGQLRENLDTASMCFRFSPLNGFQEGGFDFPLELSESLGLVGTNSISHLFSVYLNSTIQVSPFDYCLWARVAVLAYPSINPDFYGTCRPFLFEPTESKFQKLAVMYEEINAMIVDIYLESEMPTLSAEDRAIVYSHMTEDEVDEIVLSLSGYTYRVSIADDAEVISILTGGEVANWDGGPNGLNLYSFFEDEILTDGMDFSEDFIPESMVSVLLLNDASTILSMFQSTGDDSMTVVNTQNMLDTWRENFVDVFGDTAYHYHFPATENCRPMETAWMNITIIDMYSNEDGDTAEFKIMVNQQPSSPLVFAVQSQDTTEGVVFQDMVMISELTWEDGATVIVYGQLDDVDDGDVSYNVVAYLDSTDDSMYTLANPQATVTLVNQDSVAMRVTTSASVVNSTTCVTGEDGSTCTIVVQLDHWDFDKFLKANVYISTESAEVSLSTTKLTYRDGELEKEVYITGLDDSVIDGDQEFTITFETDLTIYTTEVREMTTVTITGTNTDDDFAAIESDASGILEVAEYGSEAQFAIWLSADPGATVTVPITCGDDTEGEIVDGYNEVKFTTDNWDVPVTVVLRGVQDAASDGKVEYELTVGPSVSEAESFSGLTKSVHAATQDDDTPGIRLSKDGSAIQASSMKTDETGGATNFEVRLNTQPTSNVQIAVAVTNAMENVVSPSMLTFTPSGWSTPQTVTVSGLDDFEYDGNVVNSIVVGPTSSDDPDYDGFSVTQQVVNYDDELLLYVVEDSTTSEGGESTTIKFTHASWAGTFWQLVSVTVTPRSPYEGLIDGTASPGDPSYFWVSPRAPEWQITVTGRDDSIDDGDVSYSFDVQYTITTYSGIAGKSVAPLAFSLVNVDDDTAEVISYVEWSRASEDGSEQAVVWLSLGTVPLSDVLVEVSCDSPRLRLDVSELSFTPSNYDVPQKVHVAAVNNDYADGDEVLSIVIGPVSSNDAAYAGVDEETVDLMVVDDDEAGLVVYATGNTTSETGDSARIYARLTSQPTASVLFSVGSSDGSEAATSVNVLTFNEDSWNVEQMVIVTGINDYIKDGDHPFDVVFGMIFTDDYEYILASSSTAKARLSFVNLDDNVDREEGACDFGQYVNPDYDSTRTDSMPCLPCPAGTYADSYGNTQCTKCPLGMKATGATGATQMEDACDPCEAGTYNPRRGAQTCRVCEEDKECTLAASSPTPKEDLVDGVYYDWELLEIPTYQNILAGISVDEATLQFFIAIWTLLMVVVLIIGMFVSYYFGSKKVRKLSRVMLKKVDQWSLNHSTAPMQAGDPRLKKRTDLGGFMSMMYIAIAFAMIVSLLLLFHNFNIIAFESLVPRDDTVVWDIESDYRLEVKFYGFTGPCDPSEPDEIPEPRVTTSRFETTEHHYFVDYSCEDGVYTTTWLCESCLLLGGPVISVAVENDGNEHYTFAASAVEWSLLLSDIIPQETNQVSGVISPPDSASMFRGAPAVQTYVNLIPTSYERTVAPRVPKVYGYRVQHSSNILSSVVTNVTYHDANMDGFEYILNLRMGPFQLESVVIPKRTFLDVFGALGGINASIGGLFWGMMVLVESGRHHYGKLRTKLSADKSKLKGYTWRLAKNKTATIDFERHAREDEGLKVSDGFELVVPEEMPALEPDVPRQPKVQEVWLPSLENVNDETYRQTDGSPRSARTEMSDPDADSVVGPAESDRRRSVVSSSSYTPSILASVLRLNNLPSPGGGSQHGSARSGRRSFRDRLMSSARSGGGSARRSLIQVGPVKDASPESRPSTPGVQAEYGLEESDAAAAALLRSPSPSEGSPRPHSPTQASARSDNSARQSPMLLKSLMNSARADDSASPRAPMQPAQGDVLDPLTQAERPARPSAMDSLISLRKSRAVPPPTSPPSPAVSTPDAASTPDTDGRSSDADDDEDLPPTYSPDGPQPSRQPYVQPKPDRPHVRPMPGLQEIPDEAPDARRPVLRPMPGLEKDPAPRPSLEHVPSAAPMLQEETFVPSLEGQDGTVMYSGRTAYSTSRQHLLRTARSGSARSGRSSRKGAPSARSSSSGSSVPPPLD